MKGIAAEMKDISVAVFLLCLSTCRKSDSVRKTLAGFDGPGALLVLGLLYGHSESDDTEAKAKAYAMAEEYMNRFIDRNGSVVCRELLGYDLSKPDEREKLMEKNLFKTLGPEIIRSAVNILEELLEEYKSKDE